MRIALLTNGFPPSEHGGIGTACFHLALGLRSLGFDVHVFTFNDSDPAGRGAVRGVKITRSNSFTITKCARLIGNTVGQQAGKKVCYQFGAALAGSLKVLKNLVLRIREAKPDVLLLMDKDAPGAFLPRVGERMRVLTFHHDPLRLISSPFWADHSERDARLALGLEQLSCKRSDVLVAPSVYMRTTVLKDYGLEREVYVVPNCIDSTVLDEIPETDLQKTFGINPGTMTVWVPSAGNGYKGARLLPEIVERVIDITDRDVVFLLSGTEASPEMYADIRARGIARNVLFMGKQSNLEMIAAVKSVDLLLSPTLAESFGMAILEAACCRKASVAFGVDAVPELVDDGVTGLLAPPGDCIGIAAKCSELLGDEAARTRMGAAAARKARDVYSAEHAAARYAELVS